MAPEDLQAIVDRVCQRLAPEIARAVRDALDPAACTSAGPIGTAPATDFESRRAQAFTRGLHRRPPKRKRATSPKPTRKGSPRAKRRRT